MSVSAEKSHFELGPSSAHRWFHCPGSLAAERGLPDVSSKYAEEGTAAHSLAEVAFQHNRHPEMWVGDSLGGVVVTQEMADHVETYVEALRDYADGAECVRIERQLVMPANMNPPGPMGGTCDAWFFYPEAQLLRVVDLKYGKGIVVEAEDNPQLSYYGVLAWLDLWAESKAKAQSIQEVELVIVQPRAFHPDGPIRVHRMTILQLKQFASQLLEKARAALSQSPGRVAGAYCGFCKAKLTCATFRDQALAVAQVEFGDVLEGEGVLLPAPSTLTPGELGAIMGARKTLQAWLDVVEKLVLGELEAGRPVTGYALKPKMAHRKWVGEEEVLSWVKAEKLKKADLMSQPKLLSPAQVEKVLKKVGMTLPADLCVRESTGYAITTDTDPKAVTPASLDFPALLAPPTTEEL